MPASAFLLAAALLAGGCGGDGDKEDVGRVLDRGFSQEVRSADLNLDAELRVKGAESLDRPIRVRATGPFRTNQRKLPDVDLEVDIGTGGPGQTIQTGFLSTGERAFVKFQDVYYEQPRSEVERTNRAIARNQGRRGSLKALGLDPRSWLLEARDEGDEEVAGVETDHVSGKLDVARVIRDVNDFLRRSGPALGGVAGGAPEPLSERAIDKVVEVVKDPTFDAYVGKEDGIIRRVSGRVELQVPEGDRASVGGLEGGSIEFSFELLNVNGDQRIEAPAKARPFADLRRALGSLGALAGGGRRGSPPPTSAAPDREAFRRYAECLDRARPDDMEALQRCAELLR